MRMVGISLPSGPGMYIEKTRLPGEYSTVDRILTVPPLPSGATMVAFMVFFAASHVDSVVARPAAIESDQLPMYIFLAGFHVVTPWPWNGPPMISPLKSVTRQRPLQLITLTSTPFDGGVAGAPGIIISTTASHVP